MLTQSERSDFWSPMDGANLFDNTDVKLPIDTTLHLENSGKSTSCIVDQDQIRSSGADGLSSFTANNNGFPNLLLSNSIGLTQRPTTVSAGWECPLTYSLDVKPISENVCPYGSTVSTSSIDLIGNSNGAINETVYSATGLGHYTGPQSSMYHSGAYSNSNFYGGQQGYYQAALRARAPSTAFYPLASYSNTSANTSGYYGNAYSSNSTSQFDYGTYSGYPQCYTNNYYYGPSSTTTYQLAQFPPSTSSTGGTLSDPGSALMSSISTFSFGEVSQFIKPETRKCKIKKKKTSNPSPNPEDQYKRVFIWDLDETGIHLDIAVERLVFDLVRQGFGIYNIEDYDQVHIDDATVEENVQDMTGYNVSSESLPLTIAGSTPLCFNTPGNGSIRGGIDWVRRLAARYQRIRELYNGYKENVPELLRSTCSPDRSAQLLSLRKEIEMLPDGWTGKAERCLRLVSSKPRIDRYANLLISASPLVQILAKLLLSGLAPVFPVENVYSWAKIGRESCIERVMGRFGRKCSYVMIGCTSTGGEFIGNKETIPFWPVNSFSDLDALYFALDNHMLGSTS